MAVVRLSKEVTSGIVSQARGSMQAPIDAERASFTMDGWGDRIFDVLFGAEFDTVKHMPAGWLYINSDAHIYIDSFCGIRVSRKFPLTGGRTMPGNEDVVVARLSSAGNWPARKNRNHSNYTLLNHPAWDSMYTALAEHKQRLEVLIKRQTVYVDEVIKLLNSHATLAPALKAWPPLWQLVPEPYKDRHRQVVDSKERASGQAGEKDAADLATLTALAATVRMGTHDA